MDKMICDRCHSDQNEVLILRKNRFLKTGRAKKLYHRICFRCSRKLIRDKVYQFGYYWSQVLTEVVRRK